MGNQIELSLKRASPELSEDKCACVLTGCGLRKLARARTAD